jgi:hypothetical protein
MSEATDAKLDAFQNLLDEYGVAFGYTGDTTGGTRTGLPGDGFNDALVAQAQTTQGQLFTVRFLISAWTALPVQNQALVYDGRYFTIESITPAIPGEPTITLYCRLR